MSRELASHSDEVLFALMSSPDQRQAEAAFRELYARYAQRIYSYCARILGSRYDAQDAFQETFLRFWQSAQQERTMTNVPAFLLRIARNLCLNFKRDNRAVTEFDEELHGASSLTSPTVQMEQEELRALLHQAISLLPPEYREALVLREQIGLSYTEIAELVGASETAVKVRVFRAKEKLRQLLAPYIEELRSSRSQP
ncbi:MAG: RNA polymerase sigma factor [Candidatus Kapabacteria bacterium]|nr:RNA polymerase sigma factor [Candidatus Kapabacteria bacterium]MCS7169883.1 RNA polymerase sigma factor [Candidatus Kapabacteria bacterium]MDW7997412.1 RNA polymerase sigma factor [Bacteroidota bacterium]MDW8225797.1 RNA polymerase sigma factor [Bacteroidota bacterium]